MKRPRFWLLLVVIAMGLLTWGASESISKSNSIWPKQEDEEGVLVQNLQELERDNPWWDGETPISISDIREEKGWAVGYLVTHAREEGEGPWIYLFIAHREGGQWRVAIEGSTLFFKWLEDLPELLITNQEKNLLRESQRKTPEVPLWNSAAQLGLPWPTGQAWKLTGGPHRNDSQTSHIWSSLDFQGPNRSGTVASAREGVVRRSSACPNFIRVDHADGWQTGYYHLINERVQDGQWVNRWDLLGDISTASGCGGYATGPHVHFSLRRNNQKMSIVGHDLGGWEVHAGAQPYEGYLIRVCDGTRVDRWGWVFNSAQIGSGIPPQPPSLVNPPSNATFPPTTQSVTLEWSSRPFSEYQGQLEGGPNGTISFGWQPTNTFTAVNLYPGYTYQWRIQAKQGGCIGSWSNPFSFTIQPPQPRDNWYVEIFNATDLSNVCHVYWDQDLYIFRDWESASPYPQCNDDFSTRWRRILYFPGGIYTFYCGHDDGCRLFIDGQMVIDNWQYGTYRVSTWTGNLTAGEHEILVEFFDEHVIGILDVFWVGPGYLPPPDSCAENEMWCVKYFANKDLRGVPVLQQQEDSVYIEHNWGLEGVATHLPADQFSAEWRRTAYFGNGTYRFHVRSDDGARLWLNQSLLVDEWHPNPYTEYQVDYTTTAGMYEINLEYYEETGAAAVKLWWEPVSIQPIFQDVPVSYWAWEEVERLAVGGVTTGCSTGPLRYCPGTAVTRAQMAVFLLRAKYGANYTPPSVAVAPFDDIPLDYWAVDWIAQLKNEGITSGCGGGNYCPGAPVTRAQMAVFLLRTKYGANYMPPDVTDDPFTDVPMNFWAADWIAQLVAENITSGCGGGNYCPETAVTRAQMAVFLVRTFGLP